MRKCCKKMQPEKVIMPQPKNRKTGKNVNNKLQNEKKIFLKN